MQNLLRVPAVRLYARPCSILVSRGSERLATIRHVRSIPQPPPHQITRPLSRRCRPYTGCCISPAGHHVPRTSTYKYIRDVVYTSVIHRHGISETHVDDGYVHPCFVAQFTLQIASPVPTRLCGVQFRLQRCRVRDGACAAREGIALMLRARCGIVHALCHRLVEAAAINRSSLLAQVLRRLLPLMQRHSSAEPQQQVLSRS